MLLKKQYADGEFPGSDEDYEKELARMEQAYLEAPDSDPENTAADGMLRDMHGNGILSLNVFNDEYTMMVHTSHKDNITSQSSIYVYSNNDSRDYSSRNPIPITQGESLPDAVKGSLSISYDNALAKCEEFLALAGETKNDLRVKEVTIVDDAHDGIEAQGNYAYCFTFERMANAIPIKEFGQITGGIYDEAAYSFGWSYESLAILVDDDGIAGITWEAPIETGETVQENSALLPFDKIMESYGAMMLLTYEPTVNDTLKGEFTFEMNASAAELTLLRIRKQGGASDEGMLVPVWIFYGTTTAYDEQGEKRYFSGASSFNLFNDISNGTFASEERLSPSNAFYELLEKEPVEESGIYVIINAIDGSIIDLDKGY